MSDSLSVQGDMAGGMRPSTSMDFGVHDSSDSLTAHELNKDPKYRRYVQAIDKILQSFDTISEWADVIGFLTRLAKTLLAHPGHTAIPRRLVLSKRLAQCLNPALPAGVHQKTIEIYAIILEASGTPQMAEDLPMWSHGLFPFLQNSTTSLKPAVLSLYEKYYLPLGLRLKPCLKGLILALLPVLEEESGEFFGRGIALLDSLSTSVGQSYFYQCLWLSLISTPHLRLAAVNYLLKRMPKLTSPEDVAVVIGNQTGLLARALSCVLGDDVALVQRGGLELLVVHFPLSFSLFEDDDLTLVLQAAATVVLRKDMSLNRRLYAWLLDAHEGTKLGDRPRKHLALALKALFYLEAEDINVLAKPYKILISLLDKSEIGQPVLQDILIDVIWSLRQHTARWDDRSNELMQTATMFMDMVEPSLIWKQAYQIIGGEHFDCPDGAQGCEVIEFILVHFKWHDEETQRLHLPFLYKAIIARLIGCGATAPPSILRLCNLIGAVISPEVLSNSWPLRDYVDALTDSSTDLPPTEPDTESTEMLPTIDLYYKLVDDGHASSAKFHNINFLIGKPVMQSAFDNLLAFVPSTIPVIAKETLSEDDEHAHRIAQLSFIELTKAINTLSSHLDPLKERTLVVGGDDLAADGERVAEDPEPPVWLGPLMKLCCVTDTFPTLNAALSCLLKLYTGNTHTVSRPAALQIFVRAAVPKLWEFLSAEQTAYQTRTVELLWLLCDVSSPYIVEEVIAQNMSAGTPLAQLDSFEKFGVFWRLSENAGSSANAIFSRPLFLLFDALRSNHPSIRRGGEAWFRNYVASYSSVVDSLISVLLHKSISRKHSVSLIDGEEINVYRYTNPFNEAQTDYAWESFLGVMRFADREFLKSVWTAIVRRKDFIDAIRWSQREYQIQSEKLTYGELLIILCLRFIESEPAQEANGPSPTRYESIQIHAAECLHFMLTRTDHMNYHLLVVTQTVTIRKLLHCIEIQHLELQPVLLQILHAISALMSPHRALQEVGGRSHKSESTGSLPKDLGSSPARQPTPEVEHAHADQVRSSGEFPRLRSIGSSPAFVRAVLNAITRPSNRPVLQHWMDFVLSSLPFLRKSFRRLLLPLIQKMCAELIQYRVKLSDYMARFTGDDPSRAFTEHTVMDTTACRDHDALVLLHGLQEIITACLSESSSERDGAKGLQPSGGGLKFITGYVASVFGADEKGGEGESAQQKMKETLLNMLPRIFRIFQELFVAFERTQRPKRLARAGSKSGAVDGGHEGVPPSAAAFSQVSDRLRSRVRRFLNAMYRVHPVDTLESLVEVWMAENKSASLEETHDGPVSVRMIHSIDGCVPRTAVHMIVDLVREHAALDSSPQRNQPRRSARKARTLSDASLIAFLVTYCELWIPPANLSETWVSVAALAREACAQTAQYRHLYLPILKLLGGYMTKLGASQMPDDKRLHKECEELYQKVCDYCTLIAGKAFDQGLWRKSAQTSDAPDADTTLHQSADGQELALPEIVGPRRAAKESDESQEIILYYANHAVPNMRHFVHDQDRVLALLSNMVYYIVAPHFRNKQNHKSRLNPTLDLLCAMAKVPNSQKAWRREAWDAFLDPKFFEMNLPAARSWRTIVHTMMSSDKEKVAELISRISAVPSTTIFMSKEQETAIRAHSVRRLSFAIFSGPIDQYVPKLPSIQEKLVDIFKSGTGPMIVEVYLCLRVLLSRVSPHHLANFWPTILTELIQTFDRHMSVVDADKAGDLTAFLAACKFLDMVLVLRIEAFQWHQWIFVTETQEPSDVRGAPPRPVAFIDKLCQSWTGSPSDKLWDLPSPSTIQPRAGHDPHSKTPRQRPFLLMRTISDKRDLDPFFQSISRQAYQETYTLAQPDLDFLETMLESEFLVVDDSPAVGAANVVSPANGPLLDVSAASNEPQRPTTPQLRNFTLRKDLASLTPTLPAAP
ncbi:hypothetical protein HDU87_004552 [Geranomyces variabilis]|uniref:Dopey N-terminal domain-containing protein n=1 Tax=Geranomyces variabilis TaxID=109894 RepID=A0AAD5XLU7_9FUNG|nr:hypothetical protein HDU87_004552 [Geranomyces variabilis]